MNLLKLIGDFNVQKVNNRREKSITRRINTLLTDETDFLVKEAYKSARTNIRFALGSDKKCKTIIVTSSSPHEGKTTTTLNLAIAFAQTDVKVLVIDADLRKPRISRHLSFEKENGLSDLLCGLIDIDEAIKHSEKQNIDCITSGQIPPNPAELLTSTDMETLLEKLGERYDYIFIDTPPVTVVTEAAAMSKLANGVILVVRQNNTIFESVDRARESIGMANGKILGYILNDVSGSTYGYGSYGKYGYRRPKRYSYSYSYGNYGYNYDNYGYGYSYGYGYKDKRRKKKAEEASKAETPVEKKLLFGKKDKGEIKPEKKSSKK